MFKAFWVFGVDTGISSGKTVHTVKNLLDGKYEVWEQLFKIGKYKIYVRTGEQVY